MLHISVVVFSVAKGAASGTKGGSRPARVSAVSVKDVNPRITATARMRNPLYARTPPELDERERVCVLIGLMFHRVPATGETLSRFRCIASAMAFKIVLLAGDGTGPGGMREGGKILKAVGSAYGLSFELVPYPCGGQHYLDTGEEWPDTAFEACKAADAILLGAVGIPEPRLPNGDLAGAGVIFGVRFGLDLYANVRPTKLYPNVRHKVHDSFKQVWEPGKVDFVIVRENTEGLYTPARGFLSRGGVDELAVDSRVITRKGAERVIRYAFELSKSRKGAPGDGKSRVTCVDKSNVVAGDRLFRKVYDEVAAHYPGIGRDYAYIDAFLQWLVRSPENYDVAVAPNEFGDIATDPAAVLPGGVGMAGRGDSGRRHERVRTHHGVSPHAPGEE